MELLSPRRGHDVSAVLAATRTVADERIAPAAAELDRLRTFPAENLRALSEVGALGLLVPAEHGGSGGGLAALARRARSSAARAPRPAWSSSCTRSRSRQSPAAAALATAPCLSNWPRARRSARSLSANGAPARASTARSWRSSDATERFA